MSDYAEMTKKAEEAVSQMKDQKLKQAAFAQILGHMLSDGKSVGHEKAKSTSEPKTQRVDVRPKAKFGTKAWLRELAVDGFFKQPQSSKSILTELSNRSHHLKASDLTAPLAALCHERVLRRKKISTIEGKAAIWHWSAW